VKESEIRPKELFQKYLELSQKDAEAFDTNKFEKVDCIACNSSNTTSKILKNGFDYHICNVCSTVFCNPRPTIDELNNFYWNSKSAKYWFEVFLPKVEESRRNKIFNKKAKELFSLIDKNDIHVSSLCDVGAGSGIFLEELQKIRDDISYYAIEPGKVSSKLLTNKGFKVLQSSAEFADEWHNKFDFVVSLEVLEHVNNPISFIKSINKLLKPGGSCLITSLGFEGFDILTLGVESNSISPPHHLNFPSIRGFELLFKNAGFCEVHITTPGVLDVDIVLNSGYSSDFLSVLKSRGEAAINEFQEFLITNKMSSHVWILAKK
jgi:SAM-dependent methyltransferase